MENKNNTQASQPQSKKDGQPEATPTRFAFRAVADGMQFEMTLQKSSDNTLPPTYEMVMEQLAEQKVNTGIDEGLIRALCDRPVYFRPMVVARGRQPEVGKDGSINYLVETTRELRPKLREDGTADYRDLGFVQNVKKGQVLCEITPPEKGADGVDIYGNVREGKMGKAPLNPSGKNTVLSEDGLQLLADRDGTVLVTRGVVDIQEVLNIRGNVDNATGDIEFVGDVIVNGDVVSGFNVTTTNGSITVKGNVEGATLKATEDIVVGVGINGMNRGSITAGGNIKCKFIQSCYIKSGGDIYADSVMYCHMECGGNLELNGKRAALIGGRSSIVGKLVAKTIGTNSHVATYITMASSGVEAEKELLRMEKELAQIDADTRKHLQLLTRYDELNKQGRIGGEMKETILSTKQSYIQLIERRKAVEQRQREVQAEQLRASQVNSFIECKGRIHVGVQITFGPLIMTVQNSFVNSRVCIIDNDIVVRSL